MNTLAAMSAATYGWPLQSSTSINANLSRCDQPGHWITYVVTFHDGARYKANMICKHCTAEDPSYSTDHNSLGEQVDFSLPSRLNMCNAAIYDEPPLTPNETRIVAKKVWSEARLLYLLPVDIPRDIQRTLVMTFWFTRARGNYLREIAAGLR